MMNSDIRNCKERGWPPGSSISTWASTWENKFRSPLTVKKLNKRHALSQFSQRLDGKAKILKTLPHLNIIGYRAFNKEDDGTHALVMEDGHKSLFDIIEERNDEDQEPFTASRFESVIIWEPVPSTTSTRRSTSCTGTSWLRDNVKISDFGPSN